MISRLLIKHRLSVVIIVESPYVAQRSRHLIATLAINTKINLHLLVGTNPIVWSIMVRFAKLMSITWLPVDTGI